jgi:tetratricopeptide (TPR) repeat protein
MALQYMEHVLRIKPDQANALNFIGYTWAEKGINLEKAEEMIKKALAIKPGDGYIQDSLGWLYYQKGDYKRAADELTKAHEKAPDDPVIAEHVADAYLKLGQTDRAVEFLQKALTLDTKGERKQILEEKLKGLEKKK